MEKKKISLSSENEISDKSKKKEDTSMEKKLFLARIIINFIFSLMLIAAFCLLWTSISPTWKIFFLLRIWSFWSNTFYIITITVVDILLYKNYKKCEKFNSFIRNDLIRIILPFSISTVFIYWELVLLGDKYQDIDYTVLEICKSFFIHGLVLVFMCFDVFSSKHINKKNNCLKDVIIISIIMAVHFAAVIFCKEVLDENSYDFLAMADTRQIIASFIIIYILVLNGYIILYMISDNFFIKEENKENSEKIYKEEGSGDKLKDNDDKDEGTLTGLNSKNNTNLNNNYAKSEENKIQSVDENIKEIKEEEDKKEEIKNSENYDVSDKESVKNDMDIFEKKMEKYAENFININSLNQINIKENRELLNLKKNKFGIKNIKIPEDTIVQDKKSE